MSETLILCSSEIAAPPAILEALRAGFIATAKAKQRRAEVSVTSPAQAPSGASAMLCR